MDEASQATPNRLPARDQPADNNRVEPDGVAAVFDAQA
jgi:hypothetical protein